MYNDTSIFSGTCNGLRRLSGAVGDNTNNIESNFLNIEEQLEAFRTLLESFFKLEHLDAGGKCITNVGSCCDDPSAALSRSDIDKRVGVIVDKAVTAYVARIKAQADRLGKDGDINHLLPKAEVK